jgi:hypothetical protein
MSEKSYNWQLIEFINYKNVEDVPYVDCVPSTWIIYSPCSDTLLAHYPAPPYNDEVLQELLNKVKNRECASKTWPLWNITIRGGASKI